MPLLTELAICGTHESTNRTPLRGLSILGPLKFRGVLQIPKAEAGVNEIRGNPSNLTPSNYDGRDFLYTNAFSAVVSRRRPARVGRGSSFA